MKRAMHEKQLSQMTTSAAVIPIAGKMLWMIGYRIGQVLGAGLLVTLVAGCGSLSNSPGSSSSAMIVAEAERTASVPAAPATDGTPPVAVASGLTVNPDVQIGANLTPIILVGPTHTVTAERTLVAAPQNAALSLVILHTNDTRGYVDPCG
jgi:hypothetical protein